MNKGTKILILILIFSAQSNFIIGSSILSDSLVCKSSIDSISVQEYYLTVDSMLEYPGGTLSMYDFFISHFQYPNEVDATGKIVVEFLIDIDGTIQNPRIVRSLQEMFDSETIRVVRQMPQWKPGKCRGKIVPVLMKVPFVFLIQ
jgi:periplasmic protein TonB